MKKAFALSAALLLTACMAEPAYTPPPYGYRAPPPPARAVAPAPAAPRHAAPRPLQAPQNVPSAGPVRPVTVGSYMDNQERDLRAHLHGLPVGVARPGDQIVLSIREDLLFVDSSNEFTTRGKEALATIAIIARHYDHTAIAVSGYTDTRGTPQQSIALSQQHARAVGKELMAQGVSVKRLTAQGYGATRLRIKTVENVREPRNRRIEIRITPQMSG
jgi:outer membrane protein OmpA-like peptidoglycan-associated protein